ncbi:hypothetical protein K439DRAFT_1640343, partial [Ramaria rubella]
VIFAFLRLWGCLDGRVPIPDEKPKPKPMPIFHAADMVFIRLISKRRVQLGRMIPKAVFPP